MQHFKYNISQIFFTLNRGETIILSFTSVSIVMATLELAPNPCFPPPLPHEKWEHSLWLAVDTVSVRGIEWNKDEGLPALIQVLWSDVRVFIGDAGTGGTGSKIFKHVIFL